jgi:hypothetical protein
MTVCDFLWGIQGIRDSVVKQVALCHCPSPMPNQFDPVPTALVLQPILVDLIAHRYPLKMIQAELKDKHSISIGLTTLKARLKELNLKIRSTMSPLQQRQLVLEEMGDSQGAKGVGLGTIQNMIWNKHRTIIGTQTIRKTTAVFLLL